MAAPASLPRVQKPGVPVFWVTAFASARICGQVVGAVVIPACLSSFLL